MHSCVRPYKTMYNLTRPFETLPSRQPTDTCQSPSRQFPNIFQTPTRQTPKFRHVGPFLLLEARCWFFLPFSFFLLLQWENKVNFYFNQLKWSWVCKLEWSLTIGFDTIQINLAAIIKCLGKILNKSYQPRSGEKFKGDLDPCFHFHFFT